MRPFEEEVAATQRWFDSPRFAGIVRLYAAHQGVEQRGTIASDHTVARQAAAAFHDRLRQLFAERKCITTFGPYSPGQAAAKVRGGIPYAIAKSMAPALRRGALDGDPDRRPRRRPPVRRGDPHRVPR